jgi:hypothetical protein
MNDFDIMCFLEYYADRTNVRDPITGKRAPTRQFQNFYQVAQTFSIDSDVAGSYFYLAFDVDGFSSVDAGSINQLNVDIAAVGDIVDLTEQAVGGGSLGDRKPDRARSWAKIHLMAAVRRLSAATSAALSLPA